jgi:hypothetical protein
MRGKNWIKTACPDCGQVVNFGWSASGQVRECHQCGGKINVPKHEGYEAFKAMPWSVLPMGTLRGESYAQLRHYAESERRADWYFHGDTSYTRLEWPDVVVWLKSEDVRALKSLGKGKRKPLAIDLMAVAVQPPPIEEMTHVGSSYRAN